MAFFDGIIEIFSPKWAANRAFYKAQLKAARAYEAARVDRNTDGWTATGTSANAEIGLGLDRIRNRTRDMVRNNPHAAQVPRKLAAHIVGTGIKPRPALGSDRKKGKAKENWEIFVSGSDPEGLTTFHGQTLLLARTIIESGEALIRWYDRPLSSEFPCPVQCEILEPDFLDARRTEELKNGNVVIQGVEFDRGGRRQAYWLFDHHPGETLIGRSRGYLSKRVDAKYISACFDRLRPGQVRGVPWLAPMLLALRHIDDAEFADRIKRRIAACFVGFRSIDGTDPTIPTTTETDAKGRRIEEFSPGKMIYGNPGESITFSDPPSADGYADYMIMQLHAVAAGVGMPYYMLTGDMRQATYSSARISLLDFRSLLDAWQQYMIIPQACTPAWIRVQNAAARLGTGERADIPAIWQVPARPWVDPSNESDAEDVDLQHGTTTWPEAVHRRGRDPEEVIEELEAYAPRLKALGIDLFAANPAGDQKNAKPADPAAPRRNGHDPARGNGHAEQH
jgi:lambda family phage portal protein